MNTLEIIDLNSNLFNIKFTNLNLKIKENSFNTILGASKSGKSTLANLILKKYDYEGKILYNNEELNKTKINNFVGYVASNPLTILKKHKVIDNLKYYYKKSFNEEDDFEMYLNNIYEYVNIKNILNNKIDMLSASELQLVSLSCILIKDPKLLILDEALSYLDEYYKIDILKKLKKANLTIINITKDSELALLSDNIIIINKDKVIKKSFKKILEDEKLLKNNNIEIPFIIDVSSKLKYYNTTSKIHYNISRLVNDIWK